MIQFWRFSYFRETLLTHSRSVPFCVLLFYGAENSNFSEVFAMRSLFFSDITAKPYLFFFSFFFFSELI